MKRRSFLSLLGILPLAKFLPKTPVATPSTEFNSVTGFQSLEPEFSDYPNESSTDEEAFNTMDDWNRQSLEKATRYRVIKAPLELEEARNNGGSEKYCRDLKIGDTVRVRRHPCFEVR